MKKLFLIVALAAILVPSLLAVENKPNYVASNYEASDEILKSRQEFADHGFGIFIHWGIYSMFGQGEWYLNYGVTAEEYAKAARGFYPAHFDAKEWVSAFKDAGAKYMCITARHHDGFSMFKTEQSDFNVVDATPFGRDIIKELADECARQGLKFHLYYSHLDWSRPDYPLGRTGRQTGRDSTLNNWPSYYQFMNNQLTELLTNYGDLGCLWFDGFWDHEEDSIPFDWQFEEQYALIHKLQPGCLVGNNHHKNPLAGEDIQLFERDLPGENTAGYCGDQSVSSLPLETCETMNGSWGYRINDQNYKDTKTLIHYLVKAAGKGANLLLNIGPQPSGELPATALARLKEIGQWMRENGETFYATTAPDFREQAWGTATLKGDKLYVHILNSESTDIHVPTGYKVKNAKLFNTDEKVKFTKHPEGGVTLHLNSIPEDTYDHIVELTIKK